MGSTHPWVHSTDLPYLPSVAARALRKKAWVEEIVKRFTREDWIMGLILLILLIILLLGAVPAWPYSRSWGYGPSGGVGLLLLIVIILLLLHVF